MDLYDPRYLRCTWDDSLEDKDVFFGDYISSVIADVESGTGRAECTGYSGIIDFPFRMSDADFTFVYYDPQYDVKVAYAQGKQIQCKDLVTGRWESCAEPLWHDDLEYRVKPDVPKLVPYGSAGELVDAYRKKYSVPITSTPFMWLCRKGCVQKSMVLSVDFDRNRVTLVHSGGITLSSYNMDEIMAEFTFLDGSPCGRQAE